MLRIGLLIQDLFSDYSNSIIKGARKYCTENNIQLFIYLIRSKNWVDGIYDYQYYACNSLATRDNIDGLFLITNTYCRNIPEEKYFETINELSYLPLISFGVEVPGFSSVTDSVETSFKNLLENLEKEHNCKNIYFMGPDSNAKDIKERFDIYKNFMTARNKDYSDNIFYADYLSDNAKACLKEKGISKNNLPFDALVCCTDDLAFGCIDYCKENDIKVPEDVLITGFDNQARCEFNKPSLTSIDMCIEEQCYEAARILHQEILNPNQPKQQLKINTKLINRQSTGYKNIDKNKEFVEGQYFQLREQVYSFQYFLQDLQVTDDTEKIKSILIKNYKNFGIESCVCCIYEQPVLNLKDEKFQLPERAEIFIAYNNDGIFDTSSICYVNPSKNMYPENFRFQEGKEIIVVSLFNHEFQYGYIIFTPGNLSYNTYELITSTTGISLSQNIVFSEKVHQTEKLSSEKKSLETATYFDEMTGAMNRRGLYKYALPAMKSALERGLTGSVIFGDMDHLKKINDTFGHEAGDRAIKGEVEILKRVFRTQDIIARLGGDEFVIVACGLKKETFSKVLDRLEATTKIYNDEQKEPFTISISLGFVEFDNENSNLDVLMKKADEEQYKEKLIHHKNRT